MLEHRFRAKYKALPEAYRTADLTEPADLTLNIECIALPDASVATVICNHVLEHVDDHRALIEIHRILRHDGIAILSVPIVEGWARTYENTRITLPAERELHFGQSDHIRYYGRDFLDRLHTEGFDFNEVTSTPEEVACYGLQRGESFFVCNKTKAVPDTVVV